MKESKYNFIYEYKKNYLIYNSLRNSLALMTKKDFIDFKNNKLDSEETEQYKYGGFLVDEGFDELDYIKYNLLNSRYSTCLLYTSPSPRD